MMKFKKVKRVGKATPPKSGAFKQYRNNPGDYECALIYAAWNAKKYNRELVVYGGNSYGCFVWRVCEPKALLKGNCNWLELRGWLVEPSGEIWKIEEDK